MTVIRDCTAVCPLCVTVPCSQLLMCQLLRLLCFGRSLSLVVRLRHGLPCLLPCACLCAGLWFKEGEVLSWSQHMHPWLTEN